jgi:hypothetical protein
MITRLPNFMSCFLGTGRSPRHKPPLPDPI